MKNYKFLSFSNSNFCKMSKRLRTHVQETAIGKCFIASWIQNRGHGTPSQGLVPGSSYIIALESVPKDANLHFEVAFLVNGAVRNDLIYVKSFEPKKSPYFILREKYQINALRGSEVRCLVQSGDEIWISEPSIMRSRQRKLEDSAPPFNSVCLFTKSLLSTSAQVLGLLYSLDRLDIARFLFPFSQKQIETILQIESSESPVSSTRAELTKCERVYTKYFVGNFEDTDCSGMSRIAAYHLYNLCRLMNIVLDTKINLSLGHHHHLASLGYVPTSYNPQLYSYFYVMNCSCSYCWGNTTRGSSWMLSFAYPTSLGEDDMVYNDLVGLWSHSDVFRLPFLNYNSLVHLTPAINDSKNSITFFTLSLGATYDRDFKLEPSDAFTSIHKQLSGMLSDFIYHLPAGASLEELKKWMEDNPYEILTSNQL
jgi:hypothetical protein